MSEDQTQETPMVCLETTALRYMYDAINFVHLSDSTRSCATSWRNGGCTLQHVPRPTTARSSGISGHRHIHSGMDDGDIHQELDVVEEAWNYSNRLTSPISHREKANHPHCSQQAPCRHSAGAQGPVRQSWLLNP